MFAKRFAQGYKAQQYLPPPHGTKHIKALSECYMLVLCVTLCYVLSIHYFMYALIYSVPVMWDRF